MAKPSVSKSKDQLTIGRKAKPSHKDLNDMPTEEFADYLLKKLESDEYILQSDFSDIVDRKFQTDASRRAALLFLSKPWKEMADEITKDRKLAAAFADVAMCLEGSIDRLKALADLLVTARVRINVCLAKREDMKAVMAEAKEEASHE